MIPLPTRSFPSAATASRTTPRLTSRPTVVERAPLPEQPRSLCPMTRLVVLNALRPRLGTWGTLARLSAWLLLGLLSLPLQAQLIYQDAFNYPNGPVITAPGTGWVNNYLPAGEIQVTNGSLALRQDGAESVRVDFAQVYQTGALYASFDVTFSELPKNGGNFFAFFRTSNLDNIMCRVWAFTNGAAPGTLRLGLRMRSNPVAVIPLNLKLGTPYTVVMRMTLGSVKNGTLWINPRAESDVLLKADDSESNDNQIRHFGFKQFSVPDAPENGYGNLTVDNLRIGRSFSDVVNVLRFEKVTPLKVGGVQLTGYGIPTTNYVLWASTNLAGSNWISLGNVQAQTNGVIDFTDATAVNHSRRFYRLATP